MSRDRYPYFKKGIPPDVNIFMKKLFLNYLGKEKHL